MPTFVTLPGERAERSPTNPRFAFHEDSVGAFQIRPVDRNASTACFAIGRLIRRFHQQLAHLQLAFSRRLDAAMERLRRNVAADLDSFLTLADYLAPPGQIDVLKLAVQNSVKAILNGVVTFPTPQSKSHVPVDLLDSQELFGLEQGIGSFRTSLVLPLRVADCDFGFLLEAALWTNRATDPAKAGNQSETPENGSVLSHPQMHLEQPSPSWVAKLRRFIASSKVIPLALIDEELTPFEKVKKGVTISNFIDTFHRIESKIYGELSRPGRYENDSANAPAAYAPELEPQGAEIQGPSSWQRKIVYNFRDRTCRLKQNEANLGPARIDSPTRSRYLQKLVESQEGRCSFSVLRGNRPIQDDSIRRQLTDLSAELSTLGLRISTKNGTAILEFVNPSAA